MPYPGKGSIAVGFATQPHHSGKFTVPSEAWIAGDRGNTTSYCFERLRGRNTTYISSATGVVTNGSTEQITLATISYLYNSEATGSAWSPTPPVKSPQRDRCEDPLSAISGTRVRGAVARAGTTA
jgi:hypothetical protein